MIVVPEQFVDQRVRQAGEPGRRWIRTLPELVSRRCAQWGLTLVDEAPRSGADALVLAARRGDEPCVLKISSRPASVADEARALSAWDGRGAVRLLDACPDEGALLLERLNPRRTLHERPLPAAAEIAGTLIGRLTIPAPAGLPRLADRAARLADSLHPRNQALGHPLPAALVDLAAGLQRDLAADAGGDLAHGDLHYGNVLAGTRQAWLAIDPKPVAGDRELSVPELMWTRLDDAPATADVHALLAILVEAGDLDPDRAWAWTVVRTVDYWLWGLDIGLTEDPVRCDRLLSVLTR